MNFNDDQNNDNNENDNSPSNEVKFQEYYENEGGEEKLMMTDGKNIANFQEIMDEKNRILEEDVLKSKKNANNAINSINNIKKQIENNNKSNEDIILSFHKLKEEISNSINQMQSKIKPHQIILQKG